MQRCVIIVAGGSGKRFGSDVPKQLHFLAGKPILTRSINVFTSVYPDIHVVLVVNPSIYEEVEHMLRIEGLSQVQLTEGGATRYESVKKGLALAPKVGIIGVHDAVRPLVSPAVIREAFATAASEGSGIPAMPMVNSLRKLKADGHSQAVDRAKYLMVQTPQCFKAAWIHEAYGQTKEASFTDDASVVQAANFPIFLVEGNVENIKITTPTDLLVANALLNRK